MPNPSILPVSISPEQQEQYAQRRATFLDSEIKFIAFLALLDAKLMDGGTVREGEIIALELLREEYRQNAGKILDIFDDAFGDPVTG